MATGSHLVSRLRSDSVDKYNRRAQLRLSGANVGLVFVNVFGASLIIRPENLFISPSNSLVVCSRPFLRWVRALVWDSDYCARSS